VVDNYIKSQFGKCIEKAIEGKLDSWATNAQGALALIILLVSEISIKSIALI